MAGFIGPRDIIQAITFSRVSSGHSLETLLKRRSYILVVQLNNNNNNRSNNNNCSYLIYVDFPSFADNTDVFQRRQSAPAVVVQKPLATRRSVSRRKSHCDYLRYTQTKIFKGAFDVLIFP